MTYYLTCEGPRCNNGQSAQAREHALAAELPMQTVDLRDESHKHARAMASKQLAVTPHTFFERRSGCLIFVCHECGWERVYGNTIGHLWGGWSGADMDAV